MVDVMYGAFQDDPLTLYVLLDKESRPDHPKLAQGPDMMQFLMETMFDAGAVMLQSCDWAAVAIWYVSETTALNVGSCDLCTASCCLLCMSS